MNGWDELTPARQQATWSLIKDALREPGMKKMLEKLASDSGWSGYLGQLERQNSRAQTR